MKIAPLAALRLAPAEGGPPVVKRPASFANTLDALHRVHELDIDVGLERTGENGFYGSIHLLTICDNTTASKQSLQSQKKASSSLKMTLNWRLPGLGLSFSTSKVTPVCPKQGAIPYRARLSIPDKHANKFLFALLA